LIVSAADISIGLAATQSPRGRLDGYPAAMYFIFGGVALLCALGDARTLWLGHLEGAKRLRRHIWRMSFGLWFATTSFFLGQAKVFPEPLRHAFGLRAIPVVLVLVVMFYWLWRVRTKRQHAMPAMQVLQ